MIKNRNSLKELNLAIAPGAEVHVTINGNYVKFIEGVGPLKIKTEEGTNISLPVGRSAELSEYEQISITNMGTDTGIKTIVVGYGKINDNVTAGSVGIDGAISLSSNDFVLYADNSSYNKSVENNSFIGNKHNNGNTGLWACTQIWNPVDSGILIQINRFFLQSYNDNAIYWGLTQSKLGTNQPDFINNKFDQNVLAVGEYRTFDNAVVGDYNRQSFCELYGGVEIIKTCPVIISAGNGFGGTSLLTDKNIVALIEWEEITI